MLAGTCGLVAIASASHAEGRQFDPGQVYLKLPHFPYQAQIRSILANDTPQNSPPFLGQFDPTSPNKKTSAFGNSGAEFENK